MTEDVFHFDQTRSVFGPPAWLSAAISRELQHLNTVVRAKTNNDNYQAAAKKLPQFFASCFCSEVQEFLLAARDLLDWRRTKTDWTTVALLLIDLHGKRKSALSNQMRQTKAMSPQYAINWWKERNLEPPERDPVEFMLKKVKWRYAKGHLDSGSGRIYLGDCRNVLTRWENSPSKAKASLLLTSPPYYGVTNYFYDQWLRLWLLGGPEKPHSPGDPRVPRGWAPF